MAALPIALAAPAFAGAAGEAGSPGAPVPGPPSIDIPTVESVPSIDGTLSPGEWDAAARLEIAFQIDPGDDTAPGDPTEVFLMRSADRLFVAFHAKDSDPSALRARVARRDDLFDDDYVALYLDTYDNRQHAYAFFFNPLGIQADGIYSETTEGSASRRYEDSVDLTWDGILESKGSVTADGYVVEASIPFGTLRFASGEDQLWGMHVQRRVPRRAERESWAPIRRDVSGFLVQMGSLAGMDHIFVGRTLDLIPTLTLSRTETRPPGGDLHGVNRLDPGITATWALAPHMVLSAAVNPDFSQVESDVPQIVVDQRFPLFYPEKRPFFLEGTEVFLPSQPSGSAFNMVDTRTIVDPDWGVKLTGQVGKTTVGLLGASDRAEGLQVPRGDPAYGKNAVFAVARVRRTLWKDSAVGFFVNDRSFAGSENAVFETDGLLRLSPTNAFAFQAGQTRTRDASGADTDGGFWLARLTHADTHWKAIVLDKNTGAGYENDVGFTRRTGVHSTLAQLAYDYRPEDSSRLVALQPSAFGSWSRTVEGEIDEGQWGGGIDAIFPDGVTASALAVQERDFFAGRRLGYAFYNAGCEVEKFKTISFFAYVQWGGAVNFDPALPVVGDSFQASAGATLKPSDRATSEFLYLSARLSDRSGGALLYREDIWRNRTVYQFTRNHAARAIVEYDTFIRSLSTSLLYSYTPKPNTAVYAGYGEIGFDGTDPFTGAAFSGYRPYRRTLFVKLSYDFRAGGGKRAAPASAKPRGGVSQLFAASAAKQALVLSSPSEKMAGSWPMPMRR